ncbi:DUF72 domain-containing protein [Thermocoleostomius sinensis]|uniref:DUF72 domain-containing protein n=1 Tax=Thermocoleostomius sinensis A174 TaxID=2016057 RepID=A0A9E8ZFI7_9CYAN|nr:DUF72 domain-containing protein [Thermocoleostomius sinensis]WAL60884.1 DUF72 domain-containing protein [Thermocoleostomius sinensis A174]
MDFRLGCAIWSYKDWIGEFFPVGSRAIDFLQLYSRRLTAVEANTTFYSIPEADTVQRWVTETPDGFHFCPKLPRTITHAGLLTPTLSETLAFLERMQALHPRLGPFFAQLPPTYGPSYIDDLTTFLAAFPRHDRALALEVRHPDWFQEPHATELNTRLQQLDVGRVLLDTRPIYDSPDDPQQYSQRRKPQVPLQPIVTARFSLIRYISHPDLNQNQPYLHQWVTQVQQWLQAGIQLYFFVHCPNEQQSPTIARHFQRLLEQHDVPVPSLPWDAIEEPPTQLSLF